MSFIAKQPNGLYCRFSSVIDCPSNWNMTAEEYIEMCAEKARKEAVEILNNARPFDWIFEFFEPENMTEEEFENFLKEVGYEKKGGK